MPPHANMSDNDHDTGKSAATMPPVSKPEPATPEPTVAAPDERSGPVATVGVEPVDGRVARALRLRQERSAQLLAVARRLFAERRYHQTSVQDILDAAGVARGTLYLHFDGKRAMFDTLVDSFLASIQSVVTLVDVSPNADPPLTHPGSAYASVFQETASRLVPPPLYFHIGGFTPFCPKGIHISSALP